MITIRDLTKKYGCDREKLYNMALSLVGSRLDSHGWGETSVSREDMELIGAVLKDCKLGQQSLKQRVSEIVRQYADKGYNLYQESCADPNDSKEIEYYWDGFHDCAEALIREIEAMAGDNIYEDKVEKVKAYVEKRWSELVAKKADYTDEDVLHELNREISQCGDILSFINSIRETSESSDASIPENTGKDRLAFKALPRLLDMIQPSDRVKYYCGRLADALEREDYTTDAKIVRETVRMMDGEQVAMATMDASPSKPSGFETALAEMADKAQKNVIEPWVIAAQWKDTLASLALKEVPVNRFEAAMHPCDKVIFNEELGCRVNLSQLRRVAARDTIRSEVERLKNELVKNCEGTMFEQGRISALEDTLLFIDSMPEKPVSVELEEEIHNEVVKLHTAPCYDELAAFARHFAQWQERQMMKRVKGGDLEKACREYADQQVERIYPYLSPNLPRTSRMTLKIFDGTDIELAFERGYRRKEQCLLADAVDGVIATLWPNNKGPEDILE